MISCFWATDPSEHGSEWAIVCPGPSLDDYDVEQLAGIPTIAVEGAAAHPDLPYRWWASWERPARKHKLCASRAAAVNPAIVTRWLATDHWHDWVADNLALPGHPVDPVVIGQHPKHDRIPGQFAAARLDRAPSWLLAIRYALLRGQAKTIRLVGLDLEGTGYACGLPDTLDRTPEELEGRWLGEARMLSATLALLRASSVRVERPGRPEPRGEPNVDPGTRMGV